MRNRLYIERKWGASWLSLMPRIGGYFVKGACNGHMVPTLRAISAAISAPLNQVLHSHSAAARDYLRRNDLVYRGSILQRLQEDVLGLLPDRRLAIRSGG